MLIYAIGGVPDYMLEIGGVIVFVLLLKVLANRLSRPPPTEETSGLEVQGPESHKSILWGTPPQDFEGSVARELRYVLDLPIENETMMPCVAPRIEDLIAKSAAQTSFSTLRIGQIAEGERGKEPEGIVFCIRADIIRPDKANVSQAGWNDGRNLYEMDEWIEHDGRLFGLAGIWGDLTESSIAEGRQEVDAMLPPERAMDLLKPEMIASSSEIVVEDQRYLVLRLAPVRENDADHATTLWFDADSHRLRKAETIASERGKTKLRQASAFAAYGTDATIEPPEWLNTNPEGVIVTEKVCAVEHW